MKFNSDGRIEIIPPAKPKKITGTRFASVLGLNEWSTPFETWCAITRTYEKPFVDTIYTIAGKTIEPKQAEYMQQKYFWKKLITPTDVFGKEYFQKTWGDFFPENPIFGGMWDYLFVNEDNIPEMVLEMKTTKRSEDWLEDIPEHYAMQAALYAYLLNVDDVTMVCTVLDEKDYSDPEHFEVTDNNTFTRFFKVSERYPNMKEIIETVTKWWEKYVIGGISPKYDEKRDAEILKELRSNNLNPDTDIQELIKEAEQIQNTLDEVAAQNAKAEKRLKVLKDMIKKSAEERFSDGVDRVIFTGTKYEWTTTKSVSKKIDETAMENDGVLDKYKTKESVVYKLTLKTIKGA